MKELDEKTLAAETLVPAGLHPMFRASQQPASSRSFRKRMANWRRAQRRLKGADVRRADLGMVERTVDMGRSSACECRQGQGYATILLSSVKSPASSASRIILSYRHRGRGSTRSVGSKRFPQSRWNKHGAHFTPQRRFIELVLARRRSVAIRW